MALGKNSKNKRKTQGHIGNYTDKTAPQHNECGEDTAAGYFERISIPCSRGRFAVEGRPFIHDIFEPTDGDTPDEN